MNGPYTDVKDDLRAKKGGREMGWSEACRTILTIGATNARVGDLADPVHDITGRLMEEEHLPKRIHLKSRTKRKKSDE